MRARVAGTVGVTGSAERRPGRRIPKKDVILIKRDKGDPSGSAVAEFRVFISQKTRGKPAGKAL